jgi:hypothetical protein
MPVGGRYLVMPLSAAMYYQIVGLQHDEKSQPLESLQWVVGGMIQEETAIGLWVSIDAVLDEKGNAVEVFSKGEGWRLVRWEWIPAGSALYQTKPANIGFSPRK